MSQLSRTYDKDYPIILGLSGKALTGKTTTAEGLAPLVRSSSLGDKDASLISWIKIDLAAPIYELATIRQQIVGDSSLDRQLYEIHRVVNKVFGGSPLYGAPPYDELVDLVYEIAHCYCEQEGKARSFLQYVGTDLFRKSYPDVWINYLGRRANEEYRLFIEEFKNSIETTEAEDLEPGMFGIVIGDLRFVNEANFVKNHPNGFLVRYTASIDICKERSLARDGSVMSLEQLNHVSENDLNDYPEDNFDLIIDTTELKISEQIQLTSESVLTSFEKR